MYKSSDISVIIVSYNRPSELERNFEHLVKMHSKPFEVLVVDQSEKPDTKNVCKKYSKKIKNLRYLRSEKPSIAIAKNVGVRNVSKQSKIVLFLDDDAYGGPTYMDEIIGAYNRHPEAVGIYGEEDMYNPKNFRKIKKSKFQKFKFFIEKSVKKLFLLGYRGDNGYRVLSPYGNTYTYEMKRDFPAQWFGGSNPSYKSYVFKDIRFDESFFGWSLGEDLDVAYRIHKKYGKMYIVPSSLVHISPPREDTPERRIRRIYMNQINHYYIFKKDMPEMKMRYAWNLIGIFIARALLLFDFRKFDINWIEFKHFILSLIYCSKNAKKIEHGDLSLPVK
jgi:GT2 family glycosyltransferase